VGFLGVVFLGGCTQKKPTGCLNPGLTPSQARWYSIYLLWLEGWKSDLIWFVG